MLLGGASHDRERRAPSLSADGTFDRRAPDGGRHPRFPPRVPRRGVPRDVASASARAPCSTSAAASASRPPAWPASAAWSSASTTTPRPRSTPRHEWGPQGLRFAAMDGGRIGCPIALDRLGVLVAHHRALRRTRAARRRARPGRHRRRHRARDHAEPPGRLREPVPRVVVRRPRARSRCSALFFHEVDRPGPRRHAGAPRRLRARGERAVRSSSARSLRPPAQGAPQLVRVGLRARAAGRSTRRSAPSAPASARGSTSRTSSSPTRSRPRRRACSRSHAGRDADRRYFFQSPPRIRLDRARSRPARRRSGPHSTGAPTTGRP